MWVEGGPGPIYFDISLKIVFKKILFIKGLVFCKKNDDSKMKIRFWAFVWTCRATLEINALWNKQYFLWYCLKQYASSVSSFALLCCHAPRAILFYSFSACDFILFFWGGGIWYSWNRYIHILSDDQHWLWSVHNTICEQHNTIWNQHNMICLNYFQKNNPDINPDREAMIETSPKLYLHVLIESVWR